LNLGADYTYSAFKRSDLFDKNANGWDVFLTLNIPLFSGFSSIYQQQALNAQKYALEYSRQEIVNNTNLNQVSSRKQLETAEQSILEGREALRLAVASSDEARRLFRFATIDFLQLLTIEQAYVQAESSFNTYKYNYVVALANYFVNSGQDLNRLIDILEAANR
jgi:outer membrane protein TolC